jgi:hypothetical protein
VFVFASLASAADLETIKLKAPNMDAGKNVMQAIKNRSSAHGGFSAKALPDQVVSDILWAAWGISRAEKGMRTAPSPSNKQEIDLYAFTADGVYLYEPKEHQLKQIVAKDLRALTTSGQDFVKVAPLTLLMVRVPERGVDHELGVVWTGVSAGAIVENVYLYSASEGLVNTCRVSYDGPAIIKAMGLPENQMAILAHTIGYPAEEE